MRICVLDDDLDHTEFVAHTLTSAGHICHVFTEGPRLLHELQRQTFDLLLLDWNMPEMPGDVVLQWVKQNVRIHLPILFLTSRSNESDIVHILNAGADDYIVKPVSPPLLLARVETLLRRLYRPEASATRETFDLFEFDSGTQTVVYDGTLVQLTPKEFDLALLFFRNLSRPLSRDHIRETVWRQDVDIPTRTLDTHISTIRSKLALRPQHGYRITPIYSYGYRLEKVDPSTT